tara:strand:- start:312 stop:749 length:438 start_codon:yes stop_codon:yes gene_type:complete
MKKYLIALLTLTTFIFAGAVSPVLSLRFNDISNSTDALPKPTTVIGLKMDLGNGIYSGFDVNSVTAGNATTSDFRIFIERSFGTVGIGRHHNGDPQFTIGGTYSTLSNLAVNFDYVINNLTDQDGVANTEDPFDNELRLSLSVSF